MNKKEELQGLLRKSLSAANDLANARYAYRTSDDDDGSAYDAAIAAADTADREFNAALEGSGYTNWHGTIMPVGK